MYAVPVPLHCAEFTLGVDDSVSIQMQEICILYPFLNLFRRWHDMWDPAVSVPDQQPRIVDQRLLQRVVVRGTVALFIASLFCLQAIARCCFVGPFASRLPICPFIDRCSWFSNCVLYVSAGRFRFAAHPVGFSRSAASAVFLFPLFLGVFQSEAKTCQIEK